MRFRNSRHLCKQPANDELIESGREEMGPRRSRDAILKGFLPQHYRREIKLAIQASIDEAALVGLRPGENIASDAQGGGTQRRQAG